MKGKIGVLTNHIANFFRVKNFIKKNGIEVLVSFTTFVNSLTILLGRISNIPTIISERNEPKFYKPNLVMRQMRKHLYRYASAIVLQTQKSQESFDHLGIKLPQVMKVISNPLDSQFHNKHEARDKIITSIGRLSFEKGHDMLIKAFANSITSDWKLHIIGDGVERERLILLASILDIEERIVWHGKQKDIVGILNSSEIFVLPSRTEGFPNALCEAMACGCAVISFDCPNGPSELIVHKSNGLLIPAESIVDMTHAINYLINNNNERLELASQATKIKARLDSDLICMQWQALFNELKRR